MSDIQGAQSAIPLPSAEINLGGTSTSEKQVLMASASGGVVSGSPLQCRIPGSNTMKNRAFRIRVGGRVTGGGTTNFTISLYQGNSATVSSNTKIATSSTNAVNSMSGNFYLECLCAWDSTSTKLQGIMYGWVNATAVAAAIMTSVVTTPDLTAEATLTTASGAATVPILTVTGTFSSGFAGNVAYVDLFEVTAE